MKILSIESSCDETAAALVEDGRKVLSSVVYSQIAEHRRYGGVVPEIASRRHTEQICAVTQQALDQGGLSLAQVDGVAVTAAPGLIGALLVGVNFAKSLAFAAGKPLIPVHHIRGHIAANYLAHPQLEPPFLCMVVSGGHTHIVMVEDYTTFRVLGRTRDDAAGEAFDKAARAMGFGYPGGVELDRAGKDGDPSKYSLPCGRIAPGFQLLGAEDGGHQPGPQRLPEGGGAGHPLPGRLLWGEGGRDHHPAADAGPGGDRRPGDRHGGGRGRQFPAAGPAVRRLWGEGPSPLRAAPGPLRGQCRHDRRPGLLRVPGGSSGRLGPERPGHHGPGRAVWKSVILQLFLSFRFDAIHL